MTVTSTEIQLLKFIWENKGKASWLRIVKGLRFFNPDYCRLICGSLIKNKFIKFSEGQYKITALGRKKLEKLGLIEKVEKVAKPKKAKKKVIFKKREKKKALRVKKATITELSNLTPKLVEVLKKKGLLTLEDIATTSASRLMEVIEGLELKKAAEMINEARDKLRKEGKEYLWET